MPHEPEAAGSEGPLARVVLALLGIGLLAGAGVGLVVWLEVRPTGWAAPHVGPWVFWEAALVGLAVMSAVGLGGVLWLTRDARRLLAVAHKKKGGGPHGPRRLRVALGEALGALADERDRLRTVLDALGDGVIVLDGDLRVVSLSPAASRLVEAREEPGGWKGRPLVEVIRTPRLYELAALGRQDRVQDEVRLGHPARAVFIQAAPLRASGGVVLALQDRTDVRRLERVRADFVANVSHELRTPLSVLQAHAETLVEIIDEDPAAARRFSERLLARARRLTQLVDDLLELSRIEAGHRSLARERVPVGAIAADVVASAQEAARRRGVVLSGPGGAPRSPAEAVTAWADTGGLKQVLTNLVDNAIKYARAAVWVRITAPRPGEPKGAHTVRIEVQDDGPGVALHERPRVFERFYRCDDPRTAELPGTGLGLAITRHLVDLMDGEIGISDPPQGPGTVFWVVLPARARAGGAARGEPGAPHRGASGPRQEPGPQDGGELSPR